VDADPDLLGRYGDRVPWLELPGGSSLAAGATARDVDEAFGRAAAFLRCLGGPTGGATPGLAPPDHGILGRLFRARGGRTT